MASSRSARADLRRRVPAVERVLQSPELRGLEARYGRAPLLRELRGLLGDARERAAAGDEAALDAVLSDLHGSLAARLRAGRLGAIGRLRLLGNGPAVTLRDAACDLWLTVLDDRPAPSGQVELGRWLREQTVSETRHRYGNPW